jgi:hypothetical protein
MQVAKAAARGASQVLKNWMPDRLEQPFAIGATPNSETAVDRGRHSRARIKSDTLLVMSTGKTSVWKFVTLTEKRNVCRFSPKN